jgi:hypothetical protein
MSSALFIRIADSCASDIDSPATGGFSLMKETSPLLNSSASCWTSDSSCGRGRGLAVGRLAGGLLRLPRGLELGPLRVELLLGLLDLCPALRLGGVGRRRRLLLGVAAGKGVEPGEQQDRQPPGADVPLHVSNLLRGVHGVGRQATPTPVDEATTGRPGGASPEAAKPFDERGFHLAVALTRRSAVADNRFLRRT